LAAAIGPERFLREIEIVARLNHPHIVPLFDSGTVGALLYYVMPFVSGESLRSRLDREVRLPVEVALRLTREIASALAHAHGQNLVHRDIKPENILLSDGMALVADFGIARTSGHPGERGLTTVGTSIGTPAYMSPEQAMGSPDLDGRSDLYSLACVLFEMLAGEPPFSGPTPQSILYQHGSVPPPSVTARRPDVPRGVVAALAKALAKAPEDRYPTAARLAEVLAVASSSGPERAPGTAAGRPTVPNNLPKPLTSFVGRRRELEECRELIRETRLLTVTGIGGSGKTRLALRLADSLLERFPDGVWFVDLAPIADGSRVANAVASALGVREEVGRSLVETIAREVGERALLIVLDNCEHQLEAVGPLVERLLRTAPSLHILATSREGLAVEGERLYAIRSLRAPPVESMHDVKAIEASEAVELFVDRARQVVRGFALTAGTAPVVAEICRSLDGIPLAIELAAARVEMLSVDEIRARLSDRFRLLTGGNRSLPRHQTLRATIRWSDEHLTPEEARLFRIQSVFAGGWTLEAATAVAGEGTDQFEVLDLLTRLARKSLVQVEREEAAETRYGMLETVRQYAEERLNDSGEGDRARTRHLDFYMGLAEAAGPELGGPAQAAWLSRLARDQENLLAALAWCDYVEDGGEKGLRCSGAILPYWRSRGLFEIGYRATREALERKGAGEAIPARALALYALGVLAYYRGCYDEAESPLEESFSISRARGDRPGMARALAFQGIVAAARGDRVGARGLYEEVLALARQLGDGHRISVALNGLAELDRLEGDLDRAVSRYEEALSLDRELGDVGSIVIALLNLAMVAIQRGNHEAARGRLLEATKLAQKTGSKNGGQPALDMIAALASSLGDRGRAARTWGSSEAVREKMGLRRDPADEPFVRFWIDQARAFLGEAEFDAMETEGRRLTYEDALAGALAWLESVEGLEQA
jgi:non-specific serine/threonine protein kinase